MHHYGMRDVEKLLRLPRSAIRSLVTAGFVTPTRGPRNAWLFSFQDLIVLRTAQALAAANVPQRRILRSLKELRSRLPEQMPLSGLSIGAIADHVVVREGGSRWHAASGRSLLAFEGDPAKGALRVIEPVATVPPREGHDEPVRVAGRTHPHGQPRRTGLRGDRPHQPLDGTHREPLPEAAAGRAGPGGPQPDPARETQRRLLRRLGDRRDVEGELDGCAREVEVGALQDPELDE